MTDQTASQRTASSPAEPVQQSMTFDNLGGIVVVFGGIGVFLACTALPAEEAMARALGVPQFPGFQDEPYRYVYRDFVDGVCATIGATLSLILARLTWKLTRRYSFMLTWMTLLVGLPRVLFAARIWIFSENLLTPDVILPWSTFDEYIADPLRLVLDGMAYAIALGVAVIGAYRMRPKTSRRAPTAR